MQIFKVLHDLAVEVVEKYNTDNSVFFYRTKILVLLRFLADYIPGVGLVARKYKHGYAKWHIDDVMYTTDLSSSLFALCMCRSSDGLPPRLAEDLLLQLGLKEVEMKGHDPHVWNREALSRLLLRHTQGLDEITTQHLCQSLHCQFHVSMNSWMSVGGSRHWLYSSYFVVITAHSIHVLLCLCLFGHAER